MKLYTILIFEFLYSTFLLEYSQERSYTMSEFKMFFTSCSSKNNLLLVSNSKYLQFINFREVELKFHFEKIRFSWFSYFLSISAVLKNTDMSSNLQSYFTISFVFSPEKGISVGIIRNETGYRNASNYSIFEWAFKSERKGEFMTFYQLRKICRLNFYESAWDFSRIPIKFCELAPSGIIVAKTTASSPGLLFSLQI